MVGFAVVVDLKCFWEGWVWVFAGKAWRIGLMGYGATRRNVDLLLAALRECLG